MNILSKSIKVTLCLILVHVSVACTQDKAERTRPAIYRTAGIPDVGESTDSEVLKGDITGVVLGNFQGVQNKDLEESTKAFATAFMEDPYSATIGLGNISSVFESLQETNTTGVRFSLNVCNAGSKITSNSNSGNIDTSSAGFKMYIKDSLAATNTGDYGVIEISGYTLIEKTFSNKNITLKFKNSFGTVTVNGNFSQDPEWFAGRVSFDNNVDLTSDGNPFAGDLGVFYISMNDISRNCN